MLTIDYDDTSAGLNGGAGTSFVTVTAIPEPSAALLGALGVLALFRRRGLPLQHRTRRKKLHSRSCHVQPWAVFSIKSRFRR